MSRTRSWLFAATLLLPALPAGASLETWVTAKFHELDKNGDGKLTAEEMGNAALFQQIDANHDGVVTLEEARAFFAHGLPPGLARVVPPATAEPAAAPAERPQEGSKRLSPSECRIGARIPDFALQDLEGTTVRLSEFRQKGPLILAVVSPTCPVSKRYLPTLGALHREGAAAKVPMLLVSMATAEEEPALRASLQAAGLAVPCVRDPGHALAQALGVSASTDAFVLDVAQTLIYRGAIDDQYGLGYSLETPRHRYLADAVASTLAGRQPEVEATEAPGCLVDLGAAKTVAGAPTYHNRVSRLLQSHCVECHRQGGVAPFPLETYEQVTAKAGMIRKMVDRRLMPPWFAAAPAAGEHTPWKNDRSLGADERTDLLAWLNAGKPAGDPAEAPLARQWPGEWQIGTPDAIISTPQPLEVKATGTMPYITMLVETGITEDKWVRGLEVLPTARDVVHHILVFAQPKEGRTRDFGNFFAVYVPGNNSVLYPEGFGKLLPANSKLIFQIHYTPNGTATHDQPRVGLLFAKQPPTHVVHVAEIGNHRLNIPPNDDNHPESATIPVPRSVMLLSLMPHMHLRGKSFKYEATLPDGAKRVLLEVPHYDFNWQLAYRFAEPPILPVGTTVQATGWFDNSAANPANPNPNVTVRWGPQTTDEMMLGYVEYCFVDGEPSQLSAR